MKREHHERAAGRQWCISLSFSRGRRIHMKQEHHGCAAGRQGYTQRNPGGLWIGQASS